MVEKDYARNRCPRLVTTVRWSAAWGLGVAVGNAVTGPRASGVEHAVANLGLTARKVSTANRTLTPTAGPPAGQTPYHGAGSRATPRSKSHLNPRWVSWQPTKIVLENGLIFEIESRTLNPNPK